MTRFALCVVALTVAVPASASLVSDDFTYADGDLAGNSAWSVHSGSGGTDIDVVSGAAVLSHGSGSREDVNTGFAAVSSGVITYSFDLSVSDNTAISGSDSEYFAHFLTDGSFVARLDVVPATDNTSDFSLGIATFSSTADATTAASFSFDEVISVLVSYDIDADQASLTVGGETIVGVDGSATLSVDAFALRQSNSSNDETITVDNLVVAQVAAIPEPTAALFGSLLAGALGLTVARRR